MPMAVPSSINPFLAMSVLTLWSRLSSVWWSTVIGHCVNASPAKMVSPILSSGRPEINSAATSLAASSLLGLGLMSMASILVDTSMASMMSMPSTERSPHELWVLGRASTTTTIVKARSLRSMGRWMSRCRQLFEVKR